jgi:integrase/recombinase XerC
VRRERRRPQRRESFLAHRLEQVAAATGHQEWRALRRFFTWALDEELIDRSPMAKTKPPSVPVNPVPVLRLKQLKSLFATCRSRSFNDLRDRAIMLVLLDTGLRPCRAARLAARRGRSRRRHRRRVS